MEELGESGNGSAGGGEAKGGRNRGSRHGIASALAAGMEDPYPTYAWLRENDPVYAAGPGLWLVSRYADVNSVLLSRNSSNKVVPGSTSFATMDPPEHTRLRRILVGVLTPEVVEGLRPRIRELVDGLLSRLEGHASADVVRDLALPLPITVICELLGVPKEDHSRLHDWSLDVRYAIDPVVPPERRAGARRTRAELHAYLGDLLVERRARPRQDLMSALANVQRERDDLTDENVLVLVLFLIMAGHITTTSSISGGVMTLLTHPDELERLRADASIWPSAVDELLRYDSAIQFSYRRAADEMDVDGRPVRANDRLILSLGAANRDPEQFAEPDQLDVSREPNKHLAFGAGRHLCVGRDLARAELQIALPMLFERFPNVRLDPGNPVQREGTSNLRSLTALPVLL